MKLDPYFRKDNHHKMTFAMSYNESEKYILVLSHDEVVHLKCSMINKMPGEMEDKFKNLMVGYAFMMGHPGKKLLFMGQEFAQLQEWSEARELDWYLLENPDHKHMQNWVKKLLHIYQKIRHSMNLTAAGVDLNGSMQMMLSAVFSALSERAKTERIICFLYAILHRWNAATTA